MPSSAGPNIITLGCRLNIAESDAIRGLLVDRDVTVVNSCAVTNDAVAATRRAIRRARRDRPTGALIVTGCAAQIDPASFAAMPEVDRVIGNSDKLNPAAWGSTDPVVVRDIARVLDTAPQLAGGFEGQTRAFVEVQNGCDHRCTFCAIPAGRGPSRSATIDDVVAQVAGLVLAGHAEIVLTGVDVSSYGDDLSDTPKLGDLVEAILARSGLRRLRLSSLDPAVFDPKLFELLTQEPRVMPHAHLSFQAGDDMILKRMRRRHSRADAVALVDRLKTARGEIAIGADLIAGFPTEDDAMAANTLSLIDDCDIVHAHVFPYSPRARTPAARMPQVPPPIGKARAQALRAAAERRHRDWLQRQVGTTADILVERPGTRGHSPGFADVSLPPCPPGAIVTARLIHIEGNQLIGMPL
ncbi:2-methylthioadenine synthase [Sphingomonas sp. Leaf24]|uniref:tRNA (N(6)-L-threonylcarbamoyladenosine(37)-C(2))- methylthiotransferase MtaB n=1 Tax=unclassified Sphingomonas TaxID=196159 RepID=UPI000700AF81|nr:MULTISPECIES: tRNA (N(6)-L-threonylcarbamoyladenosine(37)-C(2))-methylthiotransferase MtaB [unclassified Sphingomonas]KQM18043.1 2-methylthioadenine synthase [Sphingomonas sp. Leaf5]KQM89024.1 2-methylthioadenine synthase [Sphingomonas sp. Leaf24]